MFINWQSFWYDMIWYDTLKTSAKMSFHTESAAIWQVHMQSSPGAYAAGDLLVCDLQYAICTCFEHPVYMCWWTVEGAGDKASVSRCGQDPTETVQGVPQSSAGKDVQGRAEGSDEEDERGTVAEDGDVVTAVWFQHCGDDWTTKREYSVQ